MKIASAFSAVTLLAASAGASAALIVGTPGDVTGINGLVVQGVTYDVTFSTGSYNSAFASNAPTFLGNATGANAAALALINVLTGNSVTGISGTNCLTDLQCVLTVPDAIAPNPQGTAAAYEPAVGGWVEGFWGLPVNPTLGCYEIINGKCDYYAWTIFTAEAPANVPEPATLGLVGLGLTGMWFGRRRRVAD